MRGRDQLRTIDRPRLVVVEGEDDEGFMQALASVHGIDDVQIWSMGGKDNLPDELLGISLAPGFEQLRSLAVIRDADSSPRNARQSVLHTFKRMVDVLNNLDLSVYLFPDDTTPGMLEDLCLASVKDTPAMACVDQLMSCLEQNGCALRKPSKSRVCAYLACQPDPYPKLGVGAKKQVWNLSHSSVAPLAQFLRSF